MRRSIWSLVLGLVLAALGAASAYADGTTTTTTTTTTSTTTTTTTTTTSTTAATTTTGTTTTTPPPQAFSWLGPSYLPDSCVGAAAAAIAEPGRRVLEFGTPGSSLGPSSYPTQDPIVRFLSASAYGTACTTAHVSLTSVSLFGGVVTARYIQATHGRGSVSGLRIYGTSVGLSPGRAVHLGNWGEVTLDKTVGRLTAPLVVDLLAVHHGLPAGTTIAFAFGASPQAGHGQGARSAGVTGRSTKPPPDFPAAPSPLAKGGGLTKAARDNPVVAIAMRYLGVPYQWGGASPRTGFDCSGLVQFVFAKLGVPLVHYAASQWHSPGGVWVSPHRLQPGDLVFFVGSDGTRKTPGHVGIYVDDGYFIDAPHTGSFVRVDSLSDPSFANQYVGARRVVGASLADRHLSHVAKRDAPLTAIPLGFAPPLRYEPAGGSAAAVLTDVSHGAGVLADLGIGGLLLVFALGGVLFSRRPGSETLPSRPLG